jgi:hypothetical protein
MLGQTFSPACEKLAPHYHLLMPALTDEEVSTYL